MEDGDILLGLLETMVVLWEGAREKLESPSNKAIRAKLVGKISESLPALFNAFKVCIHVQYAQSHSQAFQVIWLPRFALCAH